MTLSLLILALTALQAPPKEEKPDARPAGFFTRSEIDFWGEKAALAKRRAEEEKKSSQESIWAEPTKRSDGRTEVYVPPKAVLQFLDDPTRENAQAYVAWQEERMKRLRAAMEILRDLQAEREAKNPPPAGVPAAQPLPVPAGEILYFKKSGCPWCAKEDEVLGPLLRTHPELRVRTVSIAESPELAEGYGVTVVPTLVLPRRSGKPLFLRGFMTEAQILGALEEVNRDPK